MSKDVQPSLNRGANQSYEGTCLGKQRFASPTLARKIAKRKPGRHAYRCPHCGGWHMATTASRQPKSGKEAYR
jgi:predicted SprT family Zn-dependent metalloprotease